MHLPKDSNCLRETLTLKVAQLFQVFLVVLCTLAPSAFAEEIRLDESTVPDPSDTSLHWTQRGLWDAIGRFPDEIRIVTRSGERYYVAQTREGSSRPTYEIKACYHAMDWYKAFTEELIVSYCSNKGKPAGGSYLRFIVDRGKMKSIEFIDTKNESPSHGCGSSTNAPPVKRHLEPDALKKSIESAINTALAEPSIPFPKDVEQIEIHLGLGDGSTHWWHSEVKTGLRPLQKKSSGNLEIEPVWKQIERFHREESEIRKKEREITELPPSTWSEASKSYNERGIKAAQASLDRSKIFYDTACSIYLSHLISLAYQYHTVKRNEEADKIFLEALAYYKLKSAKIPLADHSFWSFLSTKFSPEKFDECFFQALSIAEDATPDRLEENRELSDLNGIIHDALTNISKRDRKEDVKALLKKIIELRKAKHGFSHKSLASLQSMYTRMEQNRW